MKGEGQDRGEHPADGTRRRWVRNVLALMDADPLSPTCGCFDREYWLYRSKDFASGMQQCFVLVPALAFAGAAGPCLAGNPRLRDASLAGLGFLERLVRSDGSLDDYYPNERALGASAHVLFAACESLSTLGLGPGDHPCLRRLGRFVARATETGRLANHHAAAAAALAGLARLGVTEHVGVVDAILDRTLAMQHAEGWFQEYDGADSGYQTMTLAYLAHVWKHGGRDGLLPSLERAVAFCRQLVTPDHGFGAGLGSRGTGHLNGYGFEVLRGWVPGAAAMADLALDVNLDRQDFLHDSRFLGAQVGWHLLALRQREAAGMGLDTVLPCVPEGDVDYPGAGICRFSAGHDGMLRCYVALARGGALAVYRGERLVHAEAGLLLDADGGPAHSQGPSDFERVGRGDYVVRGGLWRGRGFVFTPWRFMASRLVLLTCGSPLRRSMRRLAQARLVTGRAVSGLDFVKRIRIDGTGLLIRWELDRRPCAPSLRGGWVCPDHAPRATASGHDFRDAGLLPRQELAGLAGHDFASPYVLETRIDA